MRGINKKNADPEILEAYKNLRNERRYPNLIFMALGGKVLLFTTFIAVMLFDISGTTRMSILLGIGYAYLMVFFGLMVAWKPKGERLRAFGIIMLFVMVLLVLAVVMTLAMGFLVTSLAS